MGFELIPEGTVIQTFFKSINVYQIRGVFSEKEFPFAPAKLLKSVEEFSFSFGDSVNDICKVLIGDDLTDDEAKWREQTKSSPPYLVILTRLKEPSICKQGYWKQENGKIITYNCFSQTKESLKKLEKKASVLVTALSVSLSSENWPVVFIPVSRDVFAKTNLNQYLEDINFSCSAEAHVSNQITTDALLEKSNAALDFYDKLHPKVGYFFDLAIREKDKLKKFIYLFLILEIHTHNAFKEIDYSSKIKELHNLPERVALSAKEFLIDRQKESKSLLQRFIWCSILKWNDIDEKDIETFKSLKKIRDRLSHGEEVVEDGLPIHQAQALALKILRL